jgi:3-ketosteroid 9alpha-monooxygenase subunit A
VSVTSIVPEFLFEYPRGWFIVGASGDFNNETPKPLYYFGRKMVGYRDTKGQVVVMDAVCPHMGAHLGHGGTIKGDTIQCPFHHWEFGASGKCTHIPYSKIIPPAAKVRSYPIHEVNGLIFLWNDAENLEPNYEIPQIPEWLDTDNWLHWDVRLRQMRTQQHEVIDNIADATHFGPVHQMHVTDFSVKFDRHMALQHQHGPSAMSYGEDGLLATDAVYHGPGYLLTYLYTEIDTIMLVGHTPIDKENLQIFFGLMIDKRAGLDADKIEAMVQHGQDSFFQDADIWENKSWVTNPLLVNGDGPILQARRWYSQFYRPRTDLPMYAGYSQAA